MSHRIPNDAYFTKNHGLTRALLSRSPVPMKVGEPCRGGGDISAVLRESGREVVESDLADGVDLFGDRAEELYTGIDAIVTNPPFYCAPAAIRRFRKWSDYVACYLRVTFLEPCTNGDSARLDLLADLNQHFVLPRASFTRDGRKDNVTGAWFVWDRRLEGKPRTFDVITPLELEEFNGQQTLGI